MAEFSKPVMGFKHLVENKGEVKVRGTELRPANLTNLVMSHGHIGLFEISNNVKYEHLMECIEYTQTKRRK
jgi:hypothetical protein